MRGVRTPFTVVLLLVGCGASSAPTPSNSTANPGDVTVFCGRPLGNAEQIEDFLGAGGGLTDARVAGPWRDLGFRHATFETLHVEGDDRWFDVSRDAAGRIRVGFERYDRNLDRFRDDLRARPFVYLGDIPRALSSQPNREDASTHEEAGSGGYSSYMPRDLGEWEELVATIVRHNVARGLRGLYYAAPGEPDYPGRFRRAPGDDSSAQLPNHIALYAATWRGVKSADSTARVGGPATMNWRITPSTASAVFGIENWIRALARHNAAAGANAVGLDFVSWQDYAWASERLSDGAEAVSRMLAENGFDPSTPKVLGGSGWGTWSSDYGEIDHPPHRRASYIAHNVIREFNDPRQRRFALALYYFFHTDDSWWEGDPENREVFRRSALVAFDTAGRTELTPMYAAFQAMRAMARGGEIVESRAPAPIEVMAVRGGEGGVIVTVNNHTGQAVTAPVSIRDVPFSGPARRAVRVIDAAHSRGGEGFEAGAVSDVEISGSTIEFPFTLGPYATVQIAWSPR